jgi:hypothetical protein
MSCILIRCTNDKNLEKIKPLLQEIALFVFSGPKFGILLPSGSGYKRTTTP